VENIFFILPQDLFSWLKEFLLLYKKYQQEKKLRQEKECTVIMSRKKNLGIRNHFAGNILNVSDI